MVAMPGISLALPLFFKRKYGSFQFNGANVNIDLDGIDLDGIDLDSFLLNVDGQVMCRFLQF